MAGSLGTQKQSHGQGYNLSAGTCSALAADDRRIVITGAGGWLGRAILDMLVRCLGPERAKERLFCFGSQQRQIVVEDGTSFQQQPIESLSDLTTCPTILLHLAFLTKDKVAGMDPEEYRTKNQSLSNLVVRALSPIGVDRLFLASSGAAKFAEDQGAAADFRIYGQLKRADELLFAEWTRGCVHRRCVIARIFSLSGPFINKHQNYALASFIRDALHGGPISIRATSTVTRSYVAIRELMSLALSALLNDRDDAVLQFDSGGVPIELGALAHSVSAALGPVGIQRPPINLERADRYVGDALRYRELLAVHSVEQVNLSQQIIETADFLARQLHIHQ